eukprot:5165381-Pyramimonas_sp.AAC.1
MEALLAVLPQRCRRAFQRARRALRERCTARPESFLVCLPYALRVLDATKFPGGSLRAIGF